MEVLRAFGKVPAPRVRLTLITRSQFAPYSGMVPGVVAGYYDKFQASIDTRALCRRAGAAAIYGEALGIDLPSRTLLRKGGDPIPFDILSLNVGSISHLPGGSAGNPRGVPVKPIEGFFNALGDICSRLVEGGRAHAKIAVIGGGAGGVELGLALHCRLKAEALFRHRPPDFVQVSLFTDKGEILAGFPHRMKRRFHEIYRERGIAIRKGTRVLSYDGRMLATEDGASEPYDEVFWVTDASPPTWLADAGLALDERGFVRVAPTLQSVNEAAVFAAGDAASLTGHDLPKSGVYAVREGAILAENLRRAAQGQPLVPYEPQRNALSLISTGERYAVGTRGGFTFEGRWVWRWKDFLDRRYIRRYRIWDTRRR